MAILFFPTIESLTASSSVNPGDRIIVGGYNINADGGGGDFICNSGGVPIYWSLPDKGIVFVSDNDPDIWYQRIINEPYINVKWFGAWGDNIHDDTDAINRAFNAALNHFDVVNNVMVCDSGNTLISIPQSSGVNSIATRTRIYFPAGYYRIEYPIARVNYNNNTYTSYDADCLEIIGDQSGITTGGTGNLFGNFFAIYLNPKRNLKITGLSFAGFNNCVKLEGNNEAQVLLDNVGFLNNHNIALEINCPNALVTCNYIKWIESQYAINLVSGNVNVVGGWLSPKSFIHENDGMIIVERGFLNMENIMGVPREESTFFKSCGWIKNIGGSIRVENFRMGGENMIGFMVVNYAKGQIYDAKNHGPHLMNPICITFIDCMLDPLKGVNLIEIPNSIIYENCYEIWTGNNMLEYDDTPQFLEKLDEMKAHFSVVLDNTPFFRGILNTGSGWMANSIGHRRASILLPYIRVNGGLDSYGYIEDADCELITPQLLKFFMGKVSSDNTIFSGIWGDYSYEVYLTNTSDLIPVGNRSDVIGNIYQYAAYRILVKIDRSNPFFPKPIVDDIQEITTPNDNNDPDAPKIIRETEFNFSSSANPNLLYVTTKGNFEGKSVKKFCIFYEVRCLIPPVTIPFGRLN